MGILPRIHLSANEGILLKRIHRYSTDHGFPGESGRFRLGLGRSWRNFRATFFVYMLTDHESSLPECLVKNQKQHHQFVHIPCHEQHIRQGIVSNKRHLESTDHPHSSIMIRYPNHHIQINPHSEESIFRHIRRSTLHIHSLNRTGCRMHQSLLLKAVKLKIPFKI